MAQLCQYEYHTWTHCNQHCDQKHCYTYISHYWHFPLNKNVYYITQICHTALLLQSTYRWYIQVKNYNFSLPCYCFICANNKYASWMSPICHLCQLLCVQIWGNYVHIYTSYKLTDMKTDQKHGYTCIPHYWYMFWNKYACHICTHVPQYFYSSLHKGPTRIQQESIKWNIYLLYYFKICASHNYTLKSHIYAMCPCYLMCTDGQSMPIYICHIWTPWHQPYDNTKSAVHRW